MGALIVHESLVNRGILKEGRIFSWSVWDQPITIYEVGELLFFLISGFFGIASNSIRSHS